MKEESSSEVNLANFEDFSRWRTYNIDQQLYYGAVGNSSRSNEFDFCLSTAFESPLVVPFRAKDVNKQALEQGIIVKPGNDAFTSVLELLKNPTHRLQISLMDTKLTVKSTFFGNVEFRLILETQTVDGPGSLRITQSIAKSLSCALSLQCGVVSELQKTISEKDRALAFMVASIRDLGFENVIRRWAPADSLNDKLLQHFDFDDWLARWSSSSSENCKTNSPADKTDLMKDLMLKKVNLIRELRNQSRDDGLRPASMSDDFGSFNSDTQNCEFSDARSGCLKKEELESVKTEELGEIKFIEDSENGPEVRKFISAKEQSPQSQQTPLRDSSSATDLSRQSSSETTVDRSPSKKKRKFGKVRVQ
ncbi:LAME_0D09780g1_1 [Lachancea meyersii CBS 8951]|uniref:LAME_0D09780g1_1 n=1 Tax=Lachancea meyersii CBS 8951 TaxID=1266667 RepID=A0A1G4JBC4_9SACH|nr:LAME_0D09780g1_1 [Lachancea meyersii CBS 8951]